MRPPSIAVHICIFELGRRKAAWIKVFRQSVLTSASTARGACVCARTRAREPQIVFVTVYRMVMDVRTIGLKCCVYRALSCLFSRPRGSRCGDGGGAHG